MKEIKTKPILKDIKVLDKTAHVSIRAKKAFIRTKEQTQQTDYDNYIEYAGDKVWEGAETVAGGAGHAMRNHGKKAFQKNKERDTADTRRADATGGDTEELAFNTGTNQKAHPKTSLLDSKATGDQQASCPRTGQPARQKTVAEFKAKESVKEKYTLSHSNQLVKQKFIQNKMKQGVVGNSEIQGSKIRATAKDTIKTVQKSVKTSGQTAQTGIKTYQAVKKVSPKRKTQSIAKTNQRMRQAARATSKFTARVGKLTVKAVAGVVNGMIGLTGTGGAILILFLILIPITALIVSPFGIFFSGENKDPAVTPIFSVVQEVNAEFSAKIEDIKASHTVDSVEMHYSGSADNIRVDNWMDVVAVFAVKTAGDKEKGMDVATMDMTRVDLIKSVFWDMNLIDFYVETTKHEKMETIENEDGMNHDKATTAYKHILHITVTSKTAGQQALEYGFTDNQKNILEEMLSGKFRLMMVALMGMDADTGLTPEQLENLYRNLPEGKLGGAAVKLALSRLGDPYSQPKAGQNNYTDCSYLVQWCYRQLSVSLPRTAAEQGKYCVDNGLTISKSDLVPGDLVFWSYESNGRFMNITHVGIYAGEGKVVDASSSRGQVAYRNLFDSDKQVLYGRPHIS